MSDDAPDPQRLIRLARQTLSAAERRRKYQRIDYLGTDFWYPTQLDSSPPAAGVYIND